MGRIKTCLLLGSSILSAFCAALPATAGSLEKICLVPVYSVPEPAHPTAAYYHNTLPHVKYPLLYGWPIDKLGRGGIFHYFREGILSEKENNPFPPDAIMDRYAAEPSGRVIGTDTSSRFYVQDEKTGDFTPHMIAGSRASAYAIKPTWIGYLGGVVIPSTAGMVLFKDNKAEPLAFPGMKAADAVAGITDLPANRAAMVATKDGRLFYVQEGKPAQEIEGISLGSHMEHGVTDIHERDEPKSLIVETDGPLFLVPLKAAGENAVTPEKAVNLGQFMSGSGDPHSTAGFSFFPWLKEYITYGRKASDPKLSLLHLKDGRVTPVERAESFTAGKYTRFEGMESRKFIIIAGGDGFYRYDGKGPLTKIEGLPAAIPVDSIDVYDLSSIGKIVFRTPAQLLELTPEGGISEIKLPQQLKGAALQRISEMNDSHAAILFTDRGFFAFNGAGEWKRLGDTGRLSFAFSEHVAMNGAIFTANDKGPLIVTDDALTGFDNCSLARNSK